VAKASYTQALLDRAQAYVGQPLNNRRYEQGLTEISLLYAAITGEAVGTCRQCQYKDFLAVVTAYIREATRFLHPELMADSKYTFAPGFAGEVIADGRYTKTVTAENITDEDAEALIKLGFGHVIVLKPGQELATSSSELAGSDFIVEPDGKSQLELDVEEERAAHEETKELLEQAHERIEGFNGAYKQVSDELAQRVQELTTEKQAHAATKAQLADVQQQLTAAKTKLSRRVTTTGATDPTTVPAVSTSDASATPTAPAVTAPAPPATPAEGTPGN
jgi:hypothetical protein